MKKVVYRFYIIAKALPTTKRIKFINKKKFAQVVLDKNFEIFIIHIAFFNLALISVYLDKKIQIASLLIEEVKILDKYSDFVNVFLKEKVVVLLA